MNAKWDVTPDGLRWLWAWAQAQPETKQMVLVRLLIVTTLRDRGEPLTEQQRLFLDGAEAAPGGSALPQK